MGVSKILTTLRTPATVLWLVLTIAAPERAAGQVCEAATEVPERKVSYLLDHPLIAVPPYDGVGLAGADSLRLEEWRGQVGLVDLQKEEIWTVSGSDTALCAALESWVRSQPGLAPEPKMAFLKARDRYVVFVWRGWDLPPGHVRLGRYTDTFFAILGSDLQLIEKVH